jgi:endonuclease YncB( thermonuclease family)
MSILNHKPSCGPTKSPMALLVVMVAALWCSPTLARDLRPVVGLVTHVRDGDTIEVNRMPIRLNGLHAPEPHEPGGAEATAWMIEHTRGQIITCRLNGEKNNDRWIGICSNRDGDLAAQIISAGLGRDCPRYSGGRYRRFEKASAARMPLPKYCFGR